MLYGPLPDKLDISSLLPGLWALAKASGEGAGFVECGAQIQRSPDGHLQIGDIVRGTASEVSLLKDEGALGIVHTHRAWPHPLRSRFWLARAEPVFMPFGATDFATAHHSDEKISVVVSAGAVLMLCQYREPAKRVPFDVIEHAFQKTCFCRGGPLDSYWDGLCEANKTLCRMLDFAWYLGNLWTPCVNLHFAPWRDRC